METMQTVRLRWQGGMCQERTCTEKPAGGFTHTYLKGMNRRANWPDSAERSRYGTRDAASIRRDTWSEVLKDGSMKVGTA